MAPADASRAVRLRGEVRLGSREGRQVPKAPHGANPPAWGTRTDSHGVPFGTGDYLWLGSREGAKRQRRRAGRTLRHPGGDLTLISSEEANQAEVGQPAYLRVRGKAGSRLM